MHIDINQTNDKTFAKVVGRIGTAETPQFEEQVRPLMMGENPVIEMDCAELNYISSSGLRIIFMLQKSVNERKGSLVLTNMQDSVLRVFNMTGFSKIVKIQ